MNGKLDAPLQDLEGLYGDNKPFLDREFLEMFRHSGLPVNSIDLIYKGWELCKKSSNSSDIE